MLAVLMVTLPVLVPLLFSGKFVPMVPMAQATVLAMYIRAVSLPISYLTLSRGDSVAYMTLEGIYDVVVVALIVAGYHYGGLTGTGIALVLSYVFNIVMVAAFAYVRYRFRFSVQVLHYAGIHMSLGLCVYIITQVERPLTYWTLGLLLCVVSLLISVYILHQKTSLWASLTKKFLNVFRRHDEG